MSKRTSSEFFLINTMINTGIDPAAYGVTEEMVVAHKPHYRWIRSYPATYGHTPTSQAFNLAFPEFPLDDGPTDLRFAAAQMVRDHRKRGAVQTITKATEALRDNDVDEAIRLMTSSNRYDVHSNKVSNALHDEDFLDCYSQRPETLGLPWKTLDDTTGGIRKGDLWYVAARLGNGKSWTLHKIAAHAVLQGFSVKIYSLEMPYHQVLVRMHTILGAELGHRVDHIAMRDRVYDPVAYKRLVGQLKEQVPGELYIQDTSYGRVSPYTIAQDKGMDLILVDYAGLMENPIGGRAIDDWRSMAAISNALKEVAIANEARVIAAAQINRDGDTPGMRPPKVKNLSQSDALGQDGDVVLTQKKCSRQVMAYSVEKNRHGEDGVAFFTRFGPNSGDFKEISQEDAEDTVDEDNS